MDPDCLYGSVAGLAGRRGPQPTPPPGRRPGPAALPSPAPGARRTWLQRHARRPQTVNIDETTMSDDGCSSVSSFRPSSVQMPRRRPSGSVTERGSLEPSSAGRESGFQSSSSLTSLAPSLAAGSLWEHPISTLSGSTLDTLGPGLGAGPSDSLASLTSGLPSFQPPPGSRRHSLSRAREPARASSSSRRSGRQTPDLAGLPPTHLAQFRPVQWFLKPLFFEVPQREPDPVFLGRDWLYREATDHLTSDLPTNRGVVISGAPGCGKTALVLKLVQHSCFGQGASGMRCEPGPLEGGGRGSNMRRLAAEVVAFHFCQIDNSVTCLAGEWVHSLAAQLAQAPALAAYHELLSTDHSLRTRLSLPQCTADPHTALTQGVLGPLALLRQAGKISGENCIILIDGLCDAEFHRPDYGDTLASFLARHLASFPAWLKIVATVRSCMKDNFKSLPFHTISLDNFDVDERVNKDMCDYIALRLGKSRSIMTNITPTAKKATDESPHTRFQKYLVDTAKGCFLFVKLTLDLIERGRLVLKSSSFKVLPQSLSEVFLLELNLKFPTAQSFRGVAEILSVCLASLRPLSLEETFHCVAALSLAPTASWTDFLASYRQISEYLVRRKDDTLMFFHPLFREWLIRRPESSPKKFLVDPRIGHAAIAMRISRMPAPVDPDSALELCHHILKAHLYRNSTSILAPRDLQSAWISLCSDDVSSALVSQKNLCSPNVNVSKLLLLSGASPDSSTLCEGGAPLICVFAQQGFGEMISLLLEFGADINRSNAQGSSAVICAAQKGSLETTRLLVERGASIAQQDRARRCALVHAATRGHLSVVEYLVTCDWSQGPAEDLDLGEAVQQATVAAAAHGHRVVLDFLLDMAEVMVDCADTLLGETPLCAAAASDRRDCCEALLAREATVSAANLQGVTPLQAAAREGHWSLCELLLKEGADLEQQDTAGRTPLMVAAKEGHLGVVELLVSRKARLEQGDKERLTALSLASAHGKLETAKFLLAHGADVNTADKTGRTPLDLAAHNGDPDLVQLLLDHGAMMEHVDINGMRPLDRAIGQRRAGAVSVFLKKGAKLGPTTWASAGGKPEIMLILLNKLLEDGNTLYKKGRLEDASVRYTYAAKRVPLGPDSEHQAVFLQLRVHLLLNLSRCKRKQLDHGEAARLASEALSLVPSCPEALHARAKASHAAGRLDAALRDLTEAVRVAPQNRELHRILLGLKLEIKEKAKVQVESKDSRDSSSGVCSSGEGSTKDFEEVGTSL